MAGCGIICVWVMPVRIGIVNGKQHVVFAAGVGQHFENVFSVRGVHDVEISIFGVPHAEAVVMLGGKADIFHAGPLGQQNPLFGVILHGIKFSGQRFIFFAGQIIARKGLFLKLGQRIDSPVNEQAEFGLMRHSINPFLLLWYQMIRLYHCIGIL